MGVTHGARIVGGVQDNLQINVISIVGGFI